MPSAVRNGGGHSPLMAFTGRFELWQIQLFKYLKDGTYSGEFTKAEKGSLCNSRRKAPSLAGQLALWEKNRKGLVTRTHTFGALPMIHG